MDRAITLLRSNNRILQIHLTSNMMKLGTNLICPTIQVKELINFGNISRAVYCIPKIVKIRSLGYYLRLRPIENIVSSDR